jgi:flavin reductase (DIM6/NTAB) family NADH-FMN oxidoreductase RutF
MSRPLTTAVLDGPAPTAGTPVDDDLFRSWFRRQASTVTVVTVAGTPPAGFTATSFTSVSLRPALVSFCVDRTSSSWPAVAKGGFLAVHMLGEHQRDVAATFARSGVDRFAAHGAWRSGPGGVPLLDDSLAWLLCRTAELVTAGDHTIVLASPLAGAYGSTGRPLVYHAGSYTRPEGG